MGALLPLLAMFLQGQGWGEACLETPASPLSFGCWNERPLSPGCARAFPSPSACKTVSLGSSSPGQTGTPCAGGAVPGRRGLM